MEWDTLDTFDPLAADGSAYAFGPLNEWEDQEAHRAWKETMFVQHYYGSRVLDTHDNLDVGKESKMNRNDPLDQPVTLRALVDTYNDLKNGDEIKGRTPSFRQVLNKLVHNATVSDFIRVDFGGPQTYVYRVAAQPTPRVQVGDLVTVPGSDYNAFPQVVRVVEVNVPKPKSLSTKPAVALSKDDAAKIESANGRSISSYHVNADGSDRR